MMRNQRTDFSRRAFILASAASFLASGARPTLGASSEEVVVEPGMDLASSISEAAASGSISRIRLKPGLHGPLSLGRVEAANPLEIVGDPGATIGLTVVRESSGIRFRTVSFRGRHGPGDTMPALVQVASNSSDIRFSDCSFATAETIDSWSDADWTDLPYPVGLLVRGPNVQVSGCRFFNLRNCLALLGDHAVVQNCRFRNFGNDGIEFGANDIRILNNIVRGGYHTPAETLHADGMQGFPAPDGGTYSDISIENNVVEFVGPGDYMQGISIFDGRWRNVRVADNTVRVNAWNAIALYGIDGATVENNTVSSTDPKIRNWIEVRASKTGEASSRVVMRNNEAPLFKTPPGAQISNNRISAVR